MTCIICGGKDTGTYGLGPCENGHTINEQIARADEEIEKAIYNPKSGKLFDLGISMQIGGISLIVCSAIFPDVQLIQNIFIFVGVLAALGSFIPLIFSFAILMRRSDGKRKRNNENI
jgi:hypothetical protein